MASLSSLLLGCFLLAAAVFLHRNGASTTTTHLHFYMHDAYTGPAPTAMRVVSGRSLLDDGGDAVPRQFGDIVALNNALTEGPSAGSTRVGTAQGFAVRVSEGGMCGDYGYPYLHDSCNLVGYTVPNIDGISL
ncbi:dirigent protein 1 [Oryza sativa Japonica Group]|uniref:dirigent protein 1 n=1 Tax=Oryza sativa subsp. japonica TaxID=39947 RepID=UPI00339CECC9